MEKMFIGPRCITCQLKHITKTVILVLSCITHLKYCLQFHRLCLTKAILVSIVCPHVYCGYLVISNMQSTFPSKSVCPTFCLDLCLFDAKLCLWCEPWVYGIMFWSLLPWQVGPSSGAPHRLGPIVVSLLSFPSSLQKISFGRFSLCRVCKKSIYLWPSWGHVRHVLIIFCICMSCVENEVWWGLTFNHLWHNNYCPSITNCVWTFTV